MRTIQSSRGHFGHLLKCFRFQSAEARKAQENSSTKKCFYSQTSYRQLSRFKKIFINCQSLGPSSILHINTKSFCIILRGTKCSEKQLLNKVRENCTLFVILPRTVHHSGGLSLMVFKLQIPL